MAKPTIVITGTPPWLASISEQLETDYIVHHQPAFDGYIRHLIESLAALILVDSRNPDWVVWTSTPKASPATRRIPLILISDDPDIRTSAGVQGADLAIATETLTDSPGQLVKEYARVPDPERMEQLDCECQDVLPELARKGLQKFNAGEYYAQHDLFEELWVATGGPVRDLYRAILQVGVAYFQIERGNYRGALKMLQRSVQWLVILPDHCQGIDVKKLRVDSFRVRAELERLGEANFDAFDHGLIQGVEYVLET